MTIDAMIRSNHQKCHQNVVSHSRFSMWHSEQVSERREKKKQSKPAEHEIIDKNSIVIFFCSLVYLLLSVCLFHSQVGRFPFLCFGCCFWKVPTHNHSLESISLRYGLQVCSPCGHFIDEEIAATNSETVDSTLLPLLLRKNKVLASGKSDFDCWVLLATNRITESERFCSMNEWLVGKASPQ